jgi:hypothetical protein
MDEHKETPTSEIFENQDEFGLKPKG